MNARLILKGTTIWIVATLFLRLRGEHLLLPHSPGRMMILFTLSFPAMALLVRRLCAALRPEQRLAGAVSLALPTLLLDPFSSVFFPVVFPNMDPAVAGIFGGWMLWCCAGALAGGLVQPPKPA